MRHVQRIPDSSERPKLIRMVLLCLVAALAEAVPARGDVWTYVVCLSGGSMLAIGRRLSRMPKAAQSDTVGALQGKPGVHPGGGQSGRAWPGDACCFAPKSPVSNRPSDRKERVA